MQNKIFPFRRDLHIGRVQSPGHTPDDEEELSLPEMAAEAVEERRHRDPWRMFAALRHANYRLFFVGQAVSLTGTWMQTVAEGWLVYQMTNSPLALGFVRFLHTIPVTLLTLLGGAVADRVDKRSICVSTQTVSMLMAFLLFGLVQGNAVEVWHVWCIAFVMGVAHAFDIPARQSFVVDMVGRKDLMNAIALNSSLFNGARIAGPGAAGLIMAGAGVATCFLFNGLSFLAVIFAYLAMKLPARQSSPSTQSLRQATWEAIRYATGHADIRSILVMVSVVSLFGWPYSVLMPIFARDILDVGASGYAFLMSANGAGAFAGAVTLAVAGDYPHKRFLMFGGAVGFSLMLLMLAVSTAVWLSCLALLIAGWCMILFFATANTMVQLTVPDRLRGRVMGFYSFCFIGLSPLGSLMAGSIARSTSAPWMVGMGALVCLVAALATYRFLPRRLSQDRSG